MSDTSKPNDLGVIISNATARKLVYGLYVIAIVVAGAAQVAYSSLEIPSPDWLVASLAVLAYLGIPVGGLAAANTK